MIYIQHHWYDYHLWIQQLIWCKICITCKISWKMYRVWRLISLIIGWYFNFIWSITLILLVIIIESILTCLYVDNKILIPHVITSYITHREPVEKLAGNSPDFHRLKYFALRESATLSWFIWQSLFDNNVKLDFTWWNFFIDQRW